MDKALLSLLLALLLDLALGDLPNRFHPVAAMGAFIRGAERACPARSPAGQFIYGMIFVLLGGALFSLPWLLLSRWMASLPFWLNVLITGLALKPVFAFRDLVKAGQAIRTALENGHLAEARKLTAWHLVSRDTRTLTTGQVSSAVVESLAENLTDSFLAPILCFLIFGLPLAWFYRFANTADAMIGYHNERFEYLGKFAARLDDLLNWLPARLAALTLVAAAGLCRMDVQAAWRVMRGQHGLTSSPNAGWTMAAAAGALGVRLEKSGCYVLNTGRSLPKAADIRRAARLVGTAALLSMIISGGLSFGISRLIG